MKPFLLLLGLALGLNVAVVAHAGGSSAATATSFAAAPVNSDLSFTVSDSSLASADPVPGAAVSSQLGDPAVEPLDALPEPGELSLVAVGLAAMGLFCRVWPRKA